MQAAGGGLGVDVEFAAQDLAQLLELPERLLSLPAVHSSGTHALALKAAAKRDKIRGSEMARAQREYELAHDD